MRIVDQLFLPSGQLCDFNAQFFEEFSTQRLLHAFTALHLATGELPIAGIDLATGTGSQQKNHRRANQHADGDFNHRAIGSAQALDAGIGPQWLVPIHVATGYLPMKSWANW